MKKKLYTILCGALLMLMASTSASATVTIGELKHYQLCPGDVINELTTRQVVVYRDTIVYDTIVTVGVTGPDSVVTVYDVNVYPRFEKTEYKEIETGQTYIWCGTPITKAGTYERRYQSIHGCDSIHRLIVTEHEYTPADPTIVDTTFTLCDNESVTFNGKTYVNAGTYLDPYTRDTLFRVTVVKHPTQLYVQNGVLDRTNPYYWQYMLDGVAKTDTLYQPGVYEHTTHNFETGCNDIWRLILTKDETSYHFVETATICENEPYSWRGRTDLNRMGIGTTTHYYDRYRSVSDQDSIYELVLRVNPVPRTMQTIPFCGSIVWNGKTYTESTTIVDTLLSVQYHCDSIVTTVLSKGFPVAHYDTVTIVTGELLQWQGQWITTAGDYTATHHSTLGCDSTYYLHVDEQVPAQPISTQSSWASICQGEGFTWYGHTYYNSGTYYDTVKTAGGEIDLLHILYLTVHPTYSSTERITFLTFPQTYREQNIPGPGEYVFTYQSMFGCDSVITAYIDREVYRDEQTAVICPGTTYIWDYDGETYTVSGKYTKVEKDQHGTDSVIHVLNLTVHYIPETHIEETICQGQPYIFGDQTLTTSGVYRYTFHTIGGCDSTVVLSLNVLSPDTTYLPIQREQGQTYQWGTETIYEPGMYFHYGTNRFGCDSVSILQFTYNQVDTIEEHLTVCQNEVPYIWNGIEGIQTQHYTKIEQQPGGNYIYYSLYLTVRDVTQVDTTFHICGDESLNFNGHTYTEGGHYRDYLNCDTLMNIHIIKHPQQVYETNAKLGTDGYTWTYMENGREYTKTFNAAGTYGFESPNPTSGCSEIWRLILTQDETIYHFVETLTICEGEDFTWRGISNLSQQGVGETSHYFDNYTSRAGKDSIYELVLTVTPVERTVRTITFCNETEWKGVTYTESAVVYDTIASANGCFRIERINLDRQTPFYSSETKELPQGTVLHWHGQNITTDGTYYDYNTTIYGCDSIYQITVTIIPASPETNQYAEELSTCEGDTIVWRGKDIWRSGTYVDTVYKAGTDNIDSIFTLHFTAWPAPKDTIYQHLYTCGAGASIRYQGQDYYTDQAVVANLKTIHGCDSIVKVFMHFNTALFLSDTVEIADTELPYTWNYRLTDVATDTVLTKAGTYNHITPAEGSCTNREQLVLIVYPTYLFEQDTTICELDLPFFWLRGPTEHQGDPIQHTIGQTKQYEYRYTTVNNTDSIYRLNLTIDEAPKRVEQVFFCEGEKIQIGSKIYFNLVSDSVYRDTVTRANTGSICDSIIYYEIYQYPKQQLIETRIIREGETIEWRGQTITTVQTQTYTQDSIDEVTGCHVINQLRVIAEMRDERVICSNDTAADVHPDKKYPFVWEHPYAAEPDTLYATGIWTDTVYNAEGGIEMFYTMDLTVVNPYDTTIYVHGCENKGAVWRDTKFERDTTFLQRVEVDPYDPKAPCDSVFHVHIVIDTIYKIRIDTTLCEYQLPFIVGRVNPDTIWAEGDFRHESDSTVCGCDSIIEGHLTIIPKLDRNDSTFVCEDYFNNGGKVTLGDTVHPAFLDNDGGKWAGKWEGKWTGVHYTQDTIVWDCNHTYFHHIIMRPSQKFPKDTTYYMCEGDSVQLFWPKTQWIKKDTVYFDTVPMGYDWSDPMHGTNYYDQKYLCDSVTKWTVKFVHPEFKDTTAHRQLGDSIWWGGEWRYYTGAYDSIGVAHEKNSDSIPCQLTYTLHLVMDTAYYYRDTVDVCAYPNTTLNHTWADGYIQSYTVGTKDTIARHYVDSLITYFRRDSIYDLCVNYRIVPTVHLFDTICEGTALRWDEHHRDNSATERYLTTAGIYYDTIPGVNVCDSVLIMHLFVRDRVPVTYNSVTVSDRLLPYLWSHTWIHNGADTTVVDTLRSSGEYTFLMPNIHGCDSIDSLSFRVHETHVFRDTADICAPLNTTLTHVWSTGYEQTYTTPLADDSVLYADTLQTRIKYDSIYVLCVNYHQTYETLVRDTICEGERYRFDLHRGNNTIERWFEQAGTYLDTIESRYGCDSVIMLKLYVRDRVPVTHNTVHIPDTAAPYSWYHAWIENGHTADSTQVLSATGEYAFRMPNIYGCDSIDSLHLFIHPTYRIQEDSITICYDQTPFTWQDRDDITATCDLTFHALTVDGYDSTRYVHIEVLPILRTVIHDTICEGDSLRFGLTKINQPRFLTNTGVYYDTLTSVQHGCDSIIELRLNTYPRFLTHQRVDLPDTAWPYYWYHVQQGDTVGVDVLRDSGEYTYTLQTIHGCDSIDSLTLVFHNTYRIQEDSITICYDETPFTWQDRNDITQTCDLISYGLTHDGYDSIRYVHIEVLPIMHTVLYDTICYGHSLHFGLSKSHYNRYITQPGVYYDTLTSVRYGCDSIIELRVNVFPTYTQHHYIDIADTEVPYVWYHIQYGDTIAIDSLYTPGAHKYTFQTSHGCDSVDNCTLRIHKTYVFRDTVTICQSETPYTWENIQDIYESGEYVRHLQTYDHYDSTLVRYVNVIPEPKVTIRHSMCEGSDYLFNGVRYAEEGTYVDTLTSTLGCDSIVTLILTVNKGVHNRIPVDIYEGESYWFYGQEYTESGTYRHYAQTEEGCDSITDLFLTVHPQIDTTVILCSSELPYMWTNKWSGETRALYDGRLYRDDTTYVNGQRTFYSLLLIVNEPQYDTIRASICAGDAYQFRGESLTQSGIYRDTVKATNGCDSVTTLVLTVNQQYFNTRVEHIIEGNSVTFFGQDYSTSGTYTHFGKTPEGCDSTSVLQLIVHPLVDTTVTICSTELPYLWVNKWSGYITPLYEAGIYRNDTSIVNGEKMYYGLQLIVNEPTDTTLYREICEGDIFNFNGQFLSTSGQYRDTIRNIHGCDSVVILNLNVLKKYYNSVDRTIYEGDTVMFQGQAYSTAGIYPVRFTSSYGCDSIIELRLTVNRLFDDSVSVCANELPLTWRGKDIYESGIYRDTAINADGKISSIGLKVNVLPIAHLEQPIVASICEGDVYQFGTRMLTEQGIYYDTLTAANGCDSIVMLSLQVHPLNFQTEYKRIFEGDSAFFNGVWYKESGIYEKREVNANNCTDTYQFVLTVLKSSNVDTVAVVCQNDLPFRWRGFEYNETGEYRIPISWTDSSRVTMTLKLTVNNTFYAERNIAICSGDTISYNGHLYFENGEFNDTIASSAGCDSIIKYIVSVHPTYDKVFEKHISDKDTLNFHDRILTQSGTFEWTGKSIYGCDSLEHLKLTVHPSFFQSDTIDLCQSDTENYPFVWKDENGRLIATITQSGVYRDSVLTAYGFDSVHQVVVNVHPMYLTKEQYEIGTGEVLKIHGKDISSPAVYYDTLRTIHGCDSIFHVVVNQKRTREFTWTKEICQGDYYDFFGKQLMSGGLYTYTSQYKDSIVYLYLTVLNTSLTKKDIVITDDDLPYAYQGKFYETGGIYTENLKNHNGCDSIVRLNIVVTEHYSDWNQIPLCSGSVLIIDQDTIRQAGQYVFLRRSKVTNKMDSLYRVEVYDAPSYEMPVETRSICQGDTVIFAGKQFYKNGVHQVKLKSVDGCDSIVTLNLTVWPAFHMDTVVKVMADELPFHWEGRDYYNSGDYDRSWQIGDCDSTRTLHLTVVETLYDTLTTTICNGQVFTWRGKQYGTDGFYVDSIVDRVNKFKAYYTLRLIVAYPTLITSARASDYIEGADEIEIHFTYSGQRPTSYSILFDNHAKQEGFEDIYDAPLYTDNVALLPFPTPSGTCYNGHSNYIRPDHYKMRLMLDNGVCGQSKSDTMEFIVKYPSWIIEQNWDDVVAPLKPECNCGYEFSSIEWYLNGKSLYVAPYMHDDRLRPGDQVEAYLTRKGTGEKPIPTHPLTIQAVTQPYNEYPIIVNPSQAPRHAPIVTITATFDGEYEVYGATGVLIQRGAFEQGDTQLTLPAVNGIYFIRTHQGDDAQTHKVLIY